MVAPGYVYTQTSIVRFDAGMAIAAVGYGFMGDAGYDSSSQSGNTTPAIALSKVGSGGALGPFQTVYVPTQDQPFAVAQSATHALAAVTNDGQSSDPGIVYVYPAAGTTFVSSSSSQVPSGRGARDVRFADLDGDGYPDLVTADSLGDTVSVSYGTDGGGFKRSISFSTQPAAGVTDYPISLAIADFDGDGQLDIATINNGSNTVSVLKGLTDGGFVTIQRLQTANPSPQFVLAAHFRGDSGPSDLVVSYEIVMGGTGNTNPIDVFLNTCDGG
jgi:hypothetical protein